MEQQELSLKDIFESLDYSHFKASFSEEENCLAILAERKWKEGFICHKCGGTRFGKGKKKYSRRCTTCKTEESATAHTIFHHCRIQLPVAFEIAYMVCGSPAIPASEISNLLDKRHMTCLHFKKKILQCIQSEGRFENPER